VTSYTITVFTVIAFSKTFAVEFQTSRISTIASR